MEHVALENEIVGSGGGCFRAGSQVLVEGGKTVAIETLKEGDTVLSFDEQGRVHRAKVTKTHYHADPQPILRVRYWGGTSHITPNHWVLNQYGAFVEIGTMSIEDALVDQLGHLRPIIEAEHVATEPVYNLTVEPHHTFICDGIRVHNGGHRQRHPLIAEDIQGAGGGGGKGDGGSVRVPVETPDNVRSKVMVSILDALGEGAIGGLVNGEKSIFFDGTPIQNADGSRNIEGVKWEQRTGTQSQSVIPGFSTVETPRDINVRVRKSQPATVTISNPDVDRVRIIMTFPALRRQDKETGDIFGTSVNFHFDIAQNNGAFQTASNVKVDHKTSSRWQKEYVLTLPKPSIENDDPASQNLEWRIRVVRDTEDSTSEALSNETYLSSIVEIIDSKLRYPNTALVGLKVDSSYFDSIPVRSYLVDGLYIKVPSNYDPVTKTYSGVWNGTFKLAISSNPAWILNDVLTNKRYGLGQFISQAMVDVEELYRIGRYCDERVPNGRGGTEPRFEINTQIQTRVEAFRLIADISAALRGMVYWAGGTARFTQDRPGEPVMRYSPANVVNGMFERSGPGASDRHTVICVSWNDPTRDYERAVEYVEDRELIQMYGIRQLDTIAFGCTSRGQAHRVGKWILYTEKYESNVISFKVGLDSANVLPGDLIEIHDPILAGKRMGGRLKDCTLNIATLDAPVKIDEFGGTKIAIRMPDGTFATRFINNKPGTTDVITWASNLPAQPLPGAMFVISEESLEPQVARVINIKQGENAGEFQIEALEHNASKYEAIEKGLDIVEPDISIVDPRKVGDVGDFKVAELSIEVAPGVVGLSLDVSWFAQNAARYEVTWRRTGTYATNWVTEHTTNPNISLGNVRAGQHQFKIIAVNGFGVRSKVFSANYSTKGRTAAPGDVANFRVQKRTNDLVLTWNEVTDIRLSGYEVRVGPDWENATVIIKNFQGTMITHDQEKAGTYYYHIRSVNSQGAYSDNVSTFKLVLEAPEAVAGFDIIQSEKRLELHWKANPEPDVVYYEIREGDSWVTGTLVSQVKATTFTIPSGSIGVRTFWIKAVASPGIYSDLAAFIGNQVAILPDRNIVFTADEANTDWAGRMLNMRRLGNDIMMVNGVARSEYIFHVDLLANYRAANSLYAQLASIVEDTDEMNWETSLFNWESDEALRHWAPGGDIDSVVGRYQIAVGAGISPADVDAWALNGDITSVTGKNGQLGAGGELVWGDGRYAQGLIPTSGSGTVKWGSVGFPAHFVYSLWVSPQIDLEGVFERKIASLQTADGSKFLRIYYSEVAGAVKLLSDAGEAMQVGVDAAKDDPILVTVVQTATQRKLFVGRLGAGEEVGAKMMVSEFAPRATFAEVLLNWNDLP